MNKERNKSSSSEAKQRRRSQKKKSEVNKRKMEELRNALENCHLTVACLPDKGRSLFTTTDFFPGDVIIKQEPYVYVPNNNNNTSKRCDGCLVSSSANTSSGGIMKCSACRSVWYCSTNCQRMEWKLHQQECKSFCRLDEERRKSITPSIRLMVRLYIKRKSQEEKVIPVTATDNYDLVEALDNYDLVEALVSHMKELDEKKLLLYAQMANLVNLILQWPDINIKEIAENLSKVACNAHTICDSELRPLGTGLYPVISIINHSCLPNAVLVFEGKSAVVRAIQHIPKGAEVLISYIETAGSTASRQKALKEQYFFTCTCPRCIKVGQNEDIQESAILEGYRCKDDRCDGFLLRDSEDKGFVCQKCGLSTSKEEVTSLLTEIRAISEMASTSTSTGNIKDAVLKYRMIEQLQRELCHHFSIRLMQTREELIKMLMELQEWKEALSCCRLTIPVYQRVYPEIHPLLGLQYYTCGKLEWLLGETDNAIKSLSKAVDILRITHGANTPFVKELLMKLDEARAEAAYKLSSRDDE